MSVWKRPRNPRAGESARATHHTYVVRWRLGGKKDGAWQSVTVGHTRGHHAEAIALDERVAATGYNATAPEVRGWLTSDDEGDDDAADRAPTVAELVDAYVERANKAESTGPTYATVAKRLGDLGAIRADQLRAVHVNRWLKGIERQGMSQSTLMRCLVVLKSATKRHADPEIFDGLRYDNTVREVQAVYLTSAQLADVLAAAEGTEMWLPIRLMAELGLRWGEMAGLRARDVDLVAKVVRVRVQIPSQSARHARFDPKPLKTRASHRDVPMGDELADALAVVKGLPLDAPVFANGTDAALSYVAWRRSWLALVASVESVPDTMRTHDLRHSCAMRWLRGGVPLGLVTEMLGHSSPAITTRMYTHWDERDRAVIINAGLSV